MAPRGAKDQSSRVLRLCWRFPQDDVSESFCANSAMHDDTAVEKLTGAALRTIPMRHFVHAASLFSRLAICCPSSADKCLLSRWNGKFTPERIPPPPSVLSAWCLRFRLSAYPCPQDIWPIASVANRSFLFRKFSARSSRRRWRGFRGTTLSFHRYLSCARAITAWPT